ncbi:hypothetical protein KAR91_50535, partial [Candidatus Pacearchaeota archaeon]|nr:hypothetical protein [Candidatus Pacearchaeota archaeon]
KDIELKGNIIPAGEPKYKPYPEIYSSSFPFFDRKAIVKTGIFLIGFLIFSTTILLLNLHVFHASDSPIYDNPYFVYAFIFLLWFLTWVAIIYIFFKILPEGFEDIAKEFFIEEG